MSPISTQPNNGFATNGLVAQLFSWFENPTAIFSVGSSACPGANEQLKAVPQGPSFPAFGQKLADLEEMDEDEDEEEVEEEEEEESMQICNLNESVLRLEELVQKKGMSLTLNDSAMNHLHDMYDELSELNSRTHASSERRSSLTMCRYIGRRFSGLRAEDLLDEQKLKQLVCEFDLEKKRELPVLTTEALKTHL